MERLLLCLKHTTMQTTVSTGHFHRTPHFVDSFLFLSGAGAGVSKVKGSGD